MVWSFYYWRQSTDISTVFCQAWKPSWPLWSSQWRKWWTSWFWLFLLSLFLPLLASNCSWEICVKNAYDGPSQMKLSSLTPPHLTTLCHSTPLGSMIQCIPTVQSVSLNILKTQVCLTYITSLVFSWACRQWKRFVAFLVWLQRITIIWKAVQMLCFVETALMLGTYYPHWDKHTNFIWSDYPSDI